MLTFSEINSKPKGGYSSDDQKQVTFTDQLTFGLGFRKALPLQFGTTNTFSEDDVISAKGLS